MVEEGQDSSLQMDSAEEVVGKDQDSGYEDCREYDEDECVDSDMEGSILHRPRPKKPIRVPDLPQRNEKRVSKIFDNAMLELQTLGAAGKEQDKSLTVKESDPHEHYLSSEEDETLSDDYEDYLSDLETTASEGAPDIRAGSSRASSRKSQEVTAVAISFQLVGKPQIIEISISPNSSPQSERTRHSMNLETLSNFNTFAKPLKKSLLRRPPPLNLHDSATRSSRRMSVSSISSVQSSTLANKSYNPNSSYIPSNAFSQSTISLNNPSSLSSRKSSRLASLTTLVTQTKLSLQTATGSTHSFLNTDPFASPAQEAITQDTDETLVVPKTPTSIAATALKRGFQKTLSKARKPSMPKISLVYTAGVVTPRTNSIVSTPTIYEHDTASVHSSDERFAKQNIVEQEIDRVKRHASMPLYPKVRSEDVPRSAVQESAAAASLAAKERKMSLKGFSRAKSIKAR